MLNQSNKNLILKAESASTGQVLYFFGAVHTNNPADEQFEHLKQVWDEFLSKSQESRVVFVEGAIHEIPRNYEESIAQYGETGAVCWLALKTNLEVIHPEPDEQEQRKHLNSLFDSDNVAYAVIAQNLSGWFRHSGPTSFEEAIERTLNREAKFAEVYGFVPEKAWFEKHHEKLFGEQKLEDKSFLDAITDPRKSDTLINKVVSARSSMRDEYIFSKIEKFWRLGNSIFIIYGKGHLLKLEGRLKSLVLG